MICMIPFDMAVLDYGAGERTMSDPCCMCACVAAGRVSIVTRIYELGTQYLASTDKSREAAVLIARHVYVM